MKKALLLGTALIAVTTTSAAHAEKYIETRESRTSTTTSNYRTTSNDVHLSPLSGFYIGGQGGYGWTDLEIEGTGVEPDVDGWDYGVFVGYKVDAILDRTVNNWGLGMNGAIEFHYNWSEADDSIGVVDFEKNHDWGVSFRPGFSAISDMTAPFGVNPYLILGYKRAEYEGSITGVGSASENYNGFELGIGTELVAYGDFGIRLDYSHTFYGEKDGIDPDENNLMLGVSYHF